MTDSKCYQATPKGTLLQQLMDSTQPKSELEWYAAQEIKTLSKLVKDLNAEVDTAYEERAMAYRELAELREAQGEPIAYMLEHEMGRLDLTFKVDEVHERLGWTHKVHELYTNAPASPDAERYQWLMGDCDGDAQDDIVRWLAGTVASKEDIDVKIDVARLKKGNKMSEDIQYVYHLVRGFEYEGSGVLSVHRSEKGARAAAKEYMSADVCYSDEGWEEDELVPPCVAAGALAEWHCGGQYLRIDLRELQE